MTASQLPRPRIGCRPVPSGGLADARGRRRDCPAPSCDPRHRRARGGRACCDDAARRTGLRHRMDIEQARFNMVEQQIRTWEVLDQDVLDLLFTVRREEFVPAPYRSLAFADLEIPLGDGAEDVDAEDGGARAAGAAPRARRVGARDRHRQRLLHRAARGPRRARDQRRDQPAAGRRGEGAGSPAPASATSSCAPATARAAVRRRRSTRSCSPARRRSCPTRSSRSSSPAAACSPSSAMRR